MSIGAHQDVWVYFGSDGGYVGVRNPSWSSEEDAILRRWWGKVPRLKVAGKLPGRSAEACQQRARKLRLKSDLWKAATSGDGGYLGDAFYLQILADFTRLSAGQIAIARGVGVEQARCWIHRAKKYRDRGKF